MADQRDKEHYAHYQQWEYCEVRQDIAQGVLHSQYILFYRVGGETREEKFHNRESAIAQLGIEGWEMVGVTGSFDETSAGFRVFFKRPLLSDTLAKS